MEDLIVFNNNIEQTVPILLEEWGFPNLVEDFQKKGIDIEVLKELNSDDLNRLIPDNLFGVRIKFRKNLYQWQLEQGCRSTAATTTVVGSWISSLPDSVNETSTLSSPITYQLTTSSPLPSSTSIDFETNSTKFDLEKELESSTSGGFILSEYKKNNSLTKSDRQYIVQVVAEHLISRGRRITNSEYKHLSQQIVHLFPSEHEETYFGTEKQRGKLAEKYYTLSKKFANCGIIKKPVKRKIVEEAHKKDKLLITDIKNLEDQQNNFLWLQKNFSPESIVFDKWKSTFDLRRLQIEDHTTNILEEWPILKQKIGASLIEIDFEILYPQKSTLLFSKWDRFCENIQKVFVREIKDPYCKKLLESLNSINNQDSKNYIITILLNGVLIPQIIKGKGSQKPWKPSILDAQKSFATHLVDKTYIQSTLELKKINNKEKNLRIQPSIIVIGDTLENITQTYIYFDDVLYEIDNYLKAVSITYQLHFVFNLEYAAECGQVWQLIEEYFYEMVTDKKRNSSLTALINELKINK